MKKSGTYLPTISSIISMAYNMIIICAHKVSNMGNIWQLSSYVMSIPVNQTCEPECIGKMVCRPEVTESSDGLPMSSCTCRKDFVDYEGEQCACELLSSIKHHDWTVEYICKSLANKSIKF